MKIWNKNIKTSNSSIDTFLSGEDIVLDQELFLYDIEASIAHAEELKAINILNASELKKMLSAQEIQIEYADIVDAKSLLRMQKNDPNASAIILIACRVGSTRLIDNLLLPSQTLSSC